VDRAGQTAGPGPAQVTGTGRRRLTLSFHLPFGLFGNNLARRSSTRQAELWSLKQEGEAGWEGSMNHMKEERN